MGGALSNLLQDQIQHNKCENNIPDNDYVLKKGSPEFCTLDTNVATNEDPCSNCLFEHKTKLCTKTDTSMDVENIRSLFDAIGDPSNKCIQEYTAHIKHKLNDDCTLRDKDEHTCQIQSDECKTWMNNLIQSYGTQFVRQPGFDTNNKSTYEQTSPAPMEFIIQSFYPNNHETLKKGAATLTYDFCLQQN